MAERYRIRAALFGPKKCPKCTDPVRKSLVSVLRDAPSTYPADEVWKREDVFALLPKELIRVDCPCGHRFFMIPDDADPPMIGFTIDDDGQLINHRAEDD